MKNQVTIKEISLTNFKGLKNQRIKFSSITDLFGANGTGKTSIYDAFLWLLFGKNSEDKKDFNIKNTVDISLNRQEHEVEGVFTINGEDNSLKRIYKEKWTKKRGEEIAEYAGNETLFYWNDVPMQLKEFTAKVNSILDENIFKIITNPLGFASLKWQDKRSILLQISGDVTDESLASGNLEYETLVANLTQGKTLEDFKKQIVASVKKAKDDLKAIPTRIDEVLKSKPEGFFDFPKLSVELDKKKIELNNIDALVLDKSSAFDSVLRANESKKTNASNLKSAIHEIESKAKIEASKETKPDTTAFDTLTKEIEKSNLDLNGSINAMATIVTKKNTIVQELGILATKIDNKREEWSIENAKELTFNDDDFHCPTCKRDFESGDVEAKKPEFVLSFNNSKTEKLTNIQRQGKSLSDEKLSQEKELEDLNERITKGNLFIDNLKIEIKTLQDEIDFEKTKLADIAPKDANVIYQSILDLDADYKSKKIELAALELTIEEVPKVDTSDLQLQKQTANSEIEILKNQLQNEDKIKSVNDRILELERQEKELAQQVANVEKTLFAIERFEKFKMESLEEKVNSKFKMVKFRMFETQVNGGESPCCEILVNGVPFADANTAGKINAGIDIINVLCDFYQITAPIFIDNRESCTEIIESNSQIVSLIVSPEDQILRVA